MKRLHYFFTAFLCLAMCISCSKDEPGGGGSGTGKATVLSVDKPTIDATYKAEKHIVLVTTDGTATPKVKHNMIDQADQLWCSSSYSSKKKEVTIRLSENFKKEERKATVEVSIDGLTQVITITQAPAILERDPFWNQYAAAEWNASWTYYTYLHDQGDEKWKFDPVNYEPAASGKYEVKNMGTTTTVGLKLDKKFLQEFSDRRLYRLELRTNGTVDVTFAILKKKSVETNTGKFPEYITETVLTEELWRSKTINHPVDTDWVIADATVDNPVDFKLSPADEELFLVAYITGGKNENDKGEFVYLQQVLSPLVPTYVSFTGVDGQNLYRFVGGNCLINFYMTAPEF